MHAWEIKKDLAGKYLRGKMTDSLPEPAVSIKNPENKFVFGASSTNLTLASRRCKRRDGSLNTFFYPDFYGRPRN